MSKRNSPTVDVHLGRVEFEDLLVRERDGTERLVDLDLGDLVQRETGLFERERDRERGRDGEVDRRARGVRESYSGV